MEKSKRKTWDIPWKELPPAMRDRYLTILWRDGYSEGAIATFLRATKGRIVRRRQTGLKLTSEGRGKIKSRVEYDRFVDLLEIEKMDDLVEKSGGDVVCFGPVEPVPQVPAPEPEPKPQVKRPRKERPSRKPKLATQQEPEVTVEAGPVESVETPPAARDVSVPPQAEDPQRSSTKEKPRYQLTTDWRQQCVHRDENRLQCSYVKEPGSDFCKLHGG